MEHKSPVTIGRLLAWFVIFFIAAIFVLWAVSAFAQAEAVAPNSWLRGVWDVISPLATLFVSIVGPALVTWIAFRVIGVLNITDENKKKELEQRVRDALHQSALNGLKFAATKYGMSAGVLPSAVVIQEAINYVRSKSPDTAQQAGVSDTDLAQIIMSKTQEVGAAITAGKPTPETAL